MLEFWKEFFSLIEPVITMQHFFCVLLLVIIFYLRRLLVVYAGLVYYALDENKKATKDWLQGQPLVVHKFSYSWVTGVNLDPMVSWAKPNEAGKPPTQI